jgi:uncharacterized membrane protein
MMALFTFYRYAGRDAAIVPCLTGGDKADHGIYADWGFGGALVCSICGNGGGCGRIEASLLSFFTVYFHCIEEH